MNYEETNNPFKRPVATPSDLNNHHAPFAPAPREEVENTDSETIEAEDSLHREIKEIEGAVSPEDRDAIHREIHKEHVSRFQRDDTLSRDINGHDKLEEETKKRWNEFSRAEEIKREAERILDAREPSGRPVTGLIREWDELSPEEKKPFGQANTVRRLLDFLTGRAVIQQRLKKGNLDNKEE